MQLKDLFKPDQFGNVPVYRDTDGHLITISTTVPGTYEYKSAVDRMQGTTTYLPDDREAIPVSSSGREDRVAIYPTPERNPLFFYKVSCVPATAENILLARILEKQK